MKYTKVVSIIWETRTKKLCLNTSLLARLHLGLSASHRGHKEGLVMTQVLK